jgi:hypothetical protein
MSAKQKTPAILAIPSSLEDAAYRLAIGSEGTRNIAQFVLEKCPGFLDTVTQETRDSLYKGWQLRKHELEGEKGYKLADGVYIPVTDPSKVDGVVMFSINVAMSYSPQEFGQLRKVDPAKHAILGDLRKKFSTYASNRMGELTAAIRSIVNEGKTKTRAPNAGFVEAMTKTFDGYEKRVKTAQTRGDREADPVRFKMAVDAFWNTYRG